jgi:hypothetical protein
VWTAPKIGDGVEAKPFYSFCGFVADTAKISYGHRTGLMKIHLNQV